MKIPLNWLKEYIKTEKTDQQIAESFTSLGLMLEKPIANKVLDLEHRFDRSDWLGILGCARDFAAFENSELVKPKIHTEKGRTISKNSQFKGGVEIRVECIDLCYRFNTRVFKNIKVAESPEWLKERLQAYGIPTINNVVDITNYVMVETGQPMHAQDLSKFEKREIVIRRAKDGEKITTLDGTEIKLDSEIFVLTQNNEPVVIGGVVGGKKTGVTENTTEIVLDAGNYNQANVRKTARKLKIQNETVLRFDKFLHPDSTEYAIKRATSLILELAGGEYYENYDYYPNPIKPKQMALHFDRVRLISGSGCDPEKILNILTKLEYKLIKKTKDKLTLELPYFRTDIEVEDDIVADILRIGNYDNIPNEVINQAPPREITSKIYNYEDKIRDVLVNLGAHEHITDPLVEKSDVSNQVLLENSLSSEKNALRVSIYETLRHLPETYYKHGIYTGSLFEIGKIYSIAENDTYLETRILQTLNFDQKMSPKELSKKTLKLLAGLFKNLGVAEYKVENKNKIFVLDRNEGYIQVGEIKFDGFYIKTEKLLVAKFHETRVKNEFENLSSEDLSIIVENSVEAGVVISTAKEFFDFVEAVEEFKGKSLGENKKSLLIRIKFSPEKVLEFQDLKQRLINKLAESLKATVRTLI